MRTLSLWPCLALSVWLAAAPPAEGGGRPFNVLVIMSDQHNARALGCYQNGYGGVSQSLTPNLDRLATEGVRFERAFCSSPSCSPMRYSTLTGRWAHNHGLRHNGVWEPRGELTFPTLARDAGYLTTAIGKHHMNWLDQPLPLSEDHGFDSVLDFQDYSAFCQSQGESTHRARGNYSAMPNLPNLLAKTGFTFNTNEFHPAGYFADRVIRFLNQAAAADRPFVCWYSMYGPHTPILPSGPAAPEDWAHMYHPYTNLDLPPNLDKVAPTDRLMDLQDKFVGVSDDEWREVLSYYYGLVTQIDWNVGRVLDELERLGMADDTVVLFVADHGEMASEMRCWTKGGGSYDATTRIPLIARLPGVLPAGKVVTDLVGNVDIFPTLLELTGVPASDAARARLDGVSTVDLMIQDVVPEEWRQEIFSEFGLPDDPDVGRGRMVRTRDAKYSIDDLNGPDAEFYDLVADEYEVDDLSGDPSPAVQSAIADLSGRLDAWWNDEQGHAPPYRETGGPAHAPRRARQPLPADNAAGVALDVDPRWLPSTAADFQRVYFGTDRANLPLFTTLAALESSFNAGSLDAASTYYWRVEQGNANGVAPGLLWSFTTAANGAGGPGLAIDPSPAHRALDVHLSARLEWAPAAGATTQDVFFGEPGSLTLLAAQLAGDAAEFDFPALEAGEEYAWRVDSVSAAGTTEGDVWTFTTDAQGLPELARGARPRHMAERVPLIQNLRLEWIAGTGAASHEVYFGTSFPLPLRATTTDASFRPGSLEAGRTYYWRVDEVSAFGTRLGWTWRLTTASLAPRGPAPR